MPRPLRLDHPGAWFHLTARGNERQPIYLDDADRLKFMSLLAVARSRFGVVCHAYCLMENHYHLVVESVEGRLSRAIQHVNGSFARYFNERRSRAGHLFQGRFKASLIERETYLLEAVRYVELNPCRANLVSRPESWDWSSFRPRLLLEAVPACLCTETLLEMFGPSADRRRQYEQFVSAGLSNLTTPSPLVDETILGSREFLTKQAKRVRDEAARRRVPSDQRFVDRPALSCLLHDCHNRQHRSVAGAAACLVHGYTMSEVADYLDVHYTTVSRWVRSAECDNS